MRDEQKALAGLKKAQAEIWQAFCIARQGSIELAEISRIERLLRELIERIEAGNKVEVNR